MEGVEHLGQFVFQMTGQKAKQLRAERGLPAIVEVEMSTAQGDVEDNDTEQAGYGEPEEEDAEAEEGKVEGFEATED